MNNLDNLDEINQYLEGHKLPKLTQEKPENCKRPVTNKEMKSVIKNLPI